MLMAQKPSQILLEQEQEQEQGCHLAPAAVLVVDSGLLLESCEETRIQRCNPTCRRDLYEL